MVILSHILILWTHTQEFTKFLKLDEESTLGTNFSMTLTRYNHLVEMANFINNLLGTIVTLSIIEIIAFYASFIHDDKIFVETHPDWKTIFNFVFYCCVDMPAIFLISASLCNKVSIHVQTIF